MKSALPLALLLCSVMLAVPAYSYTYKATVSITPVGSTTLINFTHLFLVNDPRMKTVANGGFIQHTVTRNGLVVPADFALSDDPTCATVTGGYKWDFVEYSPTAGTAQVHFLNASSVPGVALHPTPCFDDAAVTTYQGGAIGSAYDSNTIPFWPFDSGASCSALGGTDFGANGLNLTNHSATATAGKVGCAVATTTSNYMQQTSTTALQFNYNSPFSISAWLNTASTGYYGSVLNNTDTASTVRGFDFAYYGLAGYSLFGLTMVNDVTVPRYFQIFTNLGSNYATNTWYHVAVSYDGSHLASGVKIYVNGVVDGSPQVNQDTLGANTTTNSQPTNLGNNIALTQPFNGKIDEMLVSAGVRSADWILNQYTEQSSPVTMGASVPAIDLAISPAHPIAQAGNALQLTATGSGTITWSLLSGSAGSINSSTGLYTPPASVASPHAMGGCQIGAPDNVYNTRIDNLPVHASSAAWMASLPVQTIGFQPSWGTNVADNSTPTTTLNFFYSTAYSSQTWQILPYPYLKRESGYFSDPLAGPHGEAVDRHLLTVNHQTCQEGDIYNNYGPTIQPPYTAQSGWQQPTMAYTLPSSAAGNGATDAAGMALAPTTLTLDDIRSGAVKHALRVTFPRGFLAATGAWPASCGPCNGGGGLVPYGIRFRLKAATDISAFSATAQIVLLGLKRYGMMISDIGSTWAVVTSTDVTEDRTVNAALLEIYNGGAFYNSTFFEIVDESSLMVSADSAQVAYGNAYVTPPAFAIVQAADGVHTPVQTPIALQGLTLNSPDGGGVWIQSGVSKTLSVMTGNVPGTGVTWAMSPTLGTLNTSTGAYVAPAVSSPTVTQVTATSTTDPTVSVTFPVTVMPAGAIRIVPGDATANPSAPNASAPDYGPDTNGNYWWRGQANEMGTGARNDYWYGPDYGNPYVWPSIPNVGVYQTQIYSQGDNIYRFVVPNGTYAVRYSAAIGCHTSDVTPDSTYLYRQHLEVQGQIAVYDFQPLAAAGNVCTTPVSRTMSASVVDNTLTFVVRRITDHTAPIPLAVDVINSLEILPAGASAILGQGSRISGGTIK